MSAITEDFPLPWRVELRTSDGPEDQVAVIDATGQPAIYFNDREMAEFIVEAVNAHTPGEPDTRGGA